MVNNMIHNNEGYGVVLVKPTVACDVKDISAMKGIFLTSYEEIVKTLNIAYLCF